MPRHWDSGSSTSLLTPPLPPFVGSETVRDVGGLVDVGYVGLEAGLVAAGLDAVAPNLQVGVALMDLGGLGDCATTVLSPIATHSCSVSIPVGERTPRGPRRRRGTLLSWPTGRPRSVRPSLADIAIGLLFPLPTSYPVQAESFLSAPPSRLSETVSRQRPPCSIWATGSGTSATGCCFSDRGDPQKAGARQEVTRPH
jgi:hypothetical protein